MNLKQTSTQVGTLFIILDEFDISFTILFYPIAINSYILFSFSEYKYWFGMFLFNKSNT